MGKGMGYAEPPIQGAFGFAMAMNYNRAFDALIEVRSVWRIFIPNERYANKTIKLFRKFMQIEKKRYYKNSYTNCDGYEIFLMHQACEVTIDTYPDW
jgi:hypothetical protein